MGFHITRSCFTPFALCFLLSVFFFTACSTYISPAPPQSPKAQADAPSQPSVEISTNTNTNAKTEIDIETTRKTLLAADLAFSRVCEEKGAPEAFYQFMAPDGLCLLAGEASVQGRDAIKVHFAAGPPASLTWKPRDSMVSSSADLGYTWGTYESRSSTSDGPTQTAYGNYVILWKKRSDGGWKASLYVTSPSPPPAQKPGQ